MDYVVWVLFHNGSLFTICRSREEMNAPATTNSPEPVIPVPSADDEPEPSATEEPESKPAPKITQESESTTSDQVSETESSPMHEDILEYEKLF